MDVIPFIQPFSASHFKRILANRGGDESAGQVVEGGARSRDIQRMTKSNQRYLRGRWKVSGQKGGLIGFINYYWHFAQLLWG